MFFHFFAEQSSWGKVPKAVVGPRPQLPPAGVRSLGARGRPKRLPQTPCPSLATVLRALGPRDPQILCGCDARFRALVPKRDTQRAGGRSGPELTARKADAPAGPTATPHGRPPAAGGGGARGAGAGRIFHGREGAAGGQQPWGAALDRRCVPPGAGLTSPGGGGAE